uniref:Putative structural protein n=1 Tax=viral metagenome TaxID=1070528 RepID=A0A6M3IJ98_9ZZZZ
MKRICLLTLVLVFMSSLVFGATLNLRATWTANTEPDMASYKLYRTDGTRTLLGTIAHPVTLYDFSIIVPDGSQGTLTFVMTAVDTSDNESGDSNTASYPFDFQLPAAPGGFSVVKQ